MSLHPLPLSSLSRFAPLAPRHDQPYVMVAPVISTAHLPQDELDHLTRMMRDGGLLFACEDPWSAFVSVDDDYGDQLHVLAKLQATLSDLGFYWFRMDADCGDVFTDLPTYEEDAPDPLQIDPERLAAQREEALARADMAAEAVRQIERAERAEADNAALRAELQNIANAQPSQWGDMRDQFQPWAQNRARHALASPAPGSTLRAQVERMRSALNLRALAAGYDAKGDHEAADKLHRQAAALDAPAQSGDKPDLRGLLVEALAELRASDAPETYALAGREFTLVRRIEAALTHGEPAQAAPEGAEWEYWMGGDETRPIHEGDEWTDPRLPTDPWVRADWPRGSSPFGTPGFRYRRRRPIAAKAEERPDLGPLGNQLRNEREKEQA